MWSPLRIPQWRTWERTSPKLGLHGSRDRRRCRFWGEVGKHGRDPKFYPFFHKHGSVENRSLQYEFPFIYGDFPLPWLWEKGYIWADLQETLQNMREIQTFRNNSKVRVGHHKLWLSCGWGEKICSFTNLVFVLYGREYIARILEFYPNRVGFLGYLGVNGS